MSSIDRRIVQMQFDNAQFERAIRTSKQSIESFENELGMSKGLAGMEKALNTISKRFTTFGLIGQEIIRNMTNAAINGGKKMVSALVDPLIESGKQRALNIQQAKFQFQGLGMDIEASMASANAAVKGTAYGLDAAAKVASQLGASGMRAGDEMTSALRAVSGVAAMTSSSYEDIGNIMVAVAGQGRVMGDQLLQLSARGINAAATLAQYLGKTESEVREMVSDGKISFEMFYKAMDQAFGEHATRANETYTGSLSNMRAALARIGAEVYGPHFYKMRDIFNELTPQIDKAHEALMPFINALIKAEDEIGNFAIDTIKGMNFDWFEAAGDGIVNTGKAIIAVLKPIREAFLNVFPPKTPEEMVKIAEKFRDLTSKLIISEDAAKKVQAVFEYLFTALKDFNNLRMTIITDGIIPLTKSILAFAVELKDSVKEIGVFDTALEKLRSGTGKTHEILEAFQKSLLSGFKVIGKLNIGKGIKKIVDALGELEPLKFLNSLFFGEGIVQLQKLTKQITELTGIPTKFVKSITGLLNAVRESLEMYQNKLKSDILIRIAASVGVLALSLKLLSTIDLPDVVVGLAGVAVMITQLMTALKMLAMITDTVDVIKMYSLSNMLKKIAIAVGILALSVKYLSDLEWEELARGLTGVGVLMLELVASAKLLTKSTKGFNKVGIAMIEFAAAIRILVESVKELSGLSWEELGKGLAGIGGLCAEILIFLKLIDKKKDVLKNGGALVLLAGAIRLLVESVNEFKNLEWEELGKATAAIGALLLESGLFMKLASGSKHIISGAAAIAILAGSMMIFSKSVRSMGSMDYDTLIQGISSISISLISMAAALRLMPGTSIFNAAAIVIVAEALKILTDVVADMGKLGWESIGKGLTVVAAGLTAFVIALQLAEGTLPASAALLIASKALENLGDVIERLGKLSIKQVALGLGTIVVALLGLGGLTLVLSPLVPVMIGLSGAIALLGVGCLAAGVGVGLLATGLTALAAGGGAGVIVFTQAIREVLKLIPYAMKKFGEGLAEFAKVVGEYAPVLAEAFVTLVLEVLHQVVDRLAPEIVEMGGKLLKTFISGIAESVKDIKPSDIIETIDALKELMIMLGVLVVACKSAKDAKVTLIILGLVVAELAIIIYKLCELPVDDVVSVSDSLGTFFLKLSAGLLILSKVPVQGALTAVADLAILFLGATGIEYIFGWIAEIPGIGPRIDQGIEILKKVFNGLGQVFGEAIAGFATAVTSAMPGIADSLSDFMQRMQPFMAVVTNFDSSTRNGVLNLVAALIALTAAEVIQGLASWIPTKTSLVQFGDELTQFSEKLTTFYNNTQGIEYGVITNIINSIKELVKLADDIPNSGGLAAILAGDNTLSSFGDELEKFAGKYRSFYDDISGIQDGKITAFVNSLRALVKVLKEAMGINASTINELSGSLKSIAQKGIKSFIDEFTNSENKIKSAGKKMISSFTSSVDGETSKVKNSGQKIIQAFGTTITNTLSTEGSKVNTKMKTVIMAMCLAGTSTMDSYKVRFYNGGVSLIQNIANGMNSAGPRVTQAARNIVNSAANAISGYYSSYYNAGYNLPIGMGNGIYAGKSHAVNAAINVARSALNAAKQELDIHSPSKKFEELGRFTDLGFALGMSRNESSVIDAASDIGISAKDALMAVIYNLRNAVTDEFDTSPSIRPVMDLTDVKKGARSISDIMGGFNIKSNLSKDMVNSVSKLPSKIEILQKGSETKEVKQVTVNNNYNNTFNVESTDPRESAEEISYALSNQVEREEAVWA